MSQSHHPHPAPEFTAAEVETAAGALTYRLRNCRPSTDIEKEAYAFLAGRGGIRGMRADAVRAGGKFSRAHAIVVVSRMLQQLRDAGAAPTMCAEMAQELRELWTDLRFR